ncbi:CutC family protein [Zopfochytrium polystomum]|nr:CutC family protein [Zopfochytrium polystomum]
MKPRDGLAKMILEVCLETVESAVTAEQNGALRVELCANLTEGGTTPSIGTIKRCKSLVNIPIMVMIRPRGGDFVYTDEEIEIMKLDIEAAKDIGVAGVVFGLLNPDGSIDVEKTRMFVSGDFQQPRFRYSPRSVTQPADNPACRLVKLASPLQVTFHRAFDVCRDPEQAMEDIISVGGIQRILTSGQDSGALEGLELLTALVAKAKGRIILLPGGGVTPRNLKRIIAATGVKEVHMALMKTTESPMVFRNPNVFMGLPGLPEYSRVETDGDAVQKVVQILLDAQH